MNTPTTPEELTEAQMSELGAQLALDLGLKKAKGYKDRWDTRWGTKTNLGLYRTVKAVMSDGAKIAE